MANRDGRGIAGNCDQKNENMSSAEGDVMSDDNVFEVEKIVGMDTINGKAMYRVRWLGYNSQGDTWEPYENLLTCKDLVEEYLQRERTKKRKLASEKSVKQKKKQISKQKSNELTERSIPSTETNKFLDKNYSSNPLKDTFWKDLERGEIQFSADDMYSKVKERSSTRNQSQSNQGKQHKSDRKKSSSKSEGELKNTNDGRKKEKSKRRIVMRPIISDDSDDGSTRRREVHSSSETSRETGASEDSNSQPMSTAPSTTTYVQPMELDSAQQANSATTCAEVANKNETTTHLLKSAATQHLPHSGEVSHPKKTNHEKKQNNENTAPNRRTQNLYDDVVNNNNSVRNSVARMDSDDIHFEFSEYNPEEWIPKEAYNINQVVELTNVQFRNAVTAGDYEVLRRGLNSKAAFNMEQPDSSGTTLLMVAAMSGFDDIVELLVLRGANINARQRNGCTALMLAAERGHVCSVAVLLSLGAHLDIQQVSGETSLMKACRRGHKQVVQLLLEYGANFATVTNSDTTALKLAKLSDTVGLESLLIDHMSRLTSAFENQVFITLNNTACIMHALFPIHCFSLNEGNIFKIHFNHQLQPLQSGTGMLLFIAHARISPQEIKCRFYGPCAVLSVYLNDVKQLSLTENANFVLSFSPLQNGKNEVLINTVSSVISKSKLVVCAYKAQLSNKLS